MKNTISGLKITVEGIKSRPDEAEDQISKLEDKVGKNYQTEQQNRKRLKKNEECLSELQENMICSSICIIRLPEREEVEQGIENLFEKVMTENFPNMMREKVRQVQEAQRVPLKVNLKRPNPRHFIKMAKFKDRES